MIATLGGLQQAWRRNGDPPTRCERASRSPVRGLHRVQYKVQGLGFSIRARARVLYAGQTSAKGLGFSMSVMRGQVVRLRECYIRGHYTVIRRIKSDISIPPKTRVALERPLCQSWGFLGHIHSPSHQKEHIKYCMIHPWVKFQCSHNVAAAPHHHEMKRYNCVLRIYVPQDPCQ